MMFTCVSSISTKHDNSVRLFERHASSSVWVYAVNFAYKHQQYVQDSTINTQPFGPSAITYFGYEQLGWHSARKTTCSQPLNAHWDAGDNV